MGLLLKFIVSIMVLFLIFNLSLKLFEGKNVLIDSIIDVTKVLINKFKESYEHIRQHVCKKGTEVNDDSGAVFNNAELYDSSSEWED